MTKTAHSLGDEGLGDLLQILSFIIIYMEVIYNQCGFVQYAMGQFREAPKINFSKNKMLDNVFFLHHKYGLCVV